MFKHLHLFAALGLTLASPCFATVNCDGEDSTLCINLQSNGTNHYIQVKTDYFTSPPFCADQEFQGYHAINDNDLDIVTALNLINPGTNHLEIIQCDDRYCRHPISLGRYEFDLRTDNTTGGYVATPPLYTFHIESYGKGCNFFWNYKQFG